MGWTVARACVVVVCALAALWLTEGAAVACPAVYPAPASCSGDARTAVATGGTWAVSGLFAAVVAAIALRVHRAARALLAAVWLGVCLVVPVWALLASGFGADARVLLVALLLLAVLAVGWPLVAGVRERSDRATGR
ncbi:hypothetical protein [Curtobacterium sp. NPDC086286]|jgi:hypothetical protein|uniref:hypothetical protein n=1 Tax=unclassified Curtobacterium TaxID=257496 RepID=UPI0038305BEB